jgi:hypothetical protein
MLRTGRAAGRLPIIFGVLKFQAYAALKSDRPYVVGGVRRMGFYLRQAAIGGGTVSGKSE